jgi:shikimate dehydrogenase
MKHFGLVGKSLSHSFSKIYFEDKFKKLGLTDHCYHNFEISSIDEFPAIILENPQLVGLNVTIPYKESIMPFLDTFSDEAIEIGAVNCIKISGGQLKGYNTDVYGFAQSIKPFLTPNQNRALILGTGGASKAVAYVLKKIGLDVFFVSHTEKKTPQTFLYEEINKQVMKAFKLIVNTSPLGMFPNTEIGPDIPYRFFSQEHLAYDLIYNPENTLFLKQAQKNGATTINGLSMLRLQAEKNWEIWQDKNT